MNKYYFETSDNHGTFTAKDDDQARLISRCMAAIYDEELWYLDQLDDLDNAVFNLYSINWN